MAARKEMTLVGEILLKRCRDSGEILSILSGPGAALGLVFHREATISQNSFDNTSRCHRSY